MLYLAISPSKHSRNTAIKKIIDDFSEAENIRVDDLDEFFELEKFAYPSLFSEKVCLVRGMFLVDSLKNTITEKAVTVLCESPTVFVLEEHGVEKENLNILKKFGAKILLNEDKKAEKQFSPIFNLVEKICIAPTRLEKWMALQKALQTEDVEKIVSLLYWKLKQLISKENKNKLKYQKIYNDLIETHNNAWQNKLDLALVLEKFVLKK